MIRRRKVPSRRSREGLIRFAKDNTSQNGEDGVISRLFELLSEGNNSKPRRHCVDVGAWDGVHLSNTHSLLVHGNFSGVLIEADSERFQQLEELHRPFDNTCVNIAVSCLQCSPNSLSSILDNNAPDLPKDFDFLCIDVDGTDYWLMVDVFDGGYKPSVICIEFNPTMPDDIIYIQPREDGVRHGSSLSALVELAENKGYVLVETTLFNAFFVRQELYDQYLKNEVPDTSIESLHELQMGTNLFQLYDGTLKLSGCKKLLWHRLPIKEEKIQILSKEKRSFPFAPEQQKFEILGDAKKLRELAVDMSPYCLIEGDESAKMECHQRLLSQLKADGFAFIRGTGITSAVCSKALRASNAFLDEADEKVRRGTLTKDRARRGYSPMGTENFASLIGEKGHNDLVKKYRMGSELKAKDASCLLRPNVWPSADDWTEEAGAFFSESIQKYFDEQCRVTKNIVKAICDGLIASEGSIDIKKCLSVFDLEADAGATQDTSILTLLNYTKGKRHQKSKHPKPLVAAHTDVGVITCLLFDKGDCAVLQRANANAQDVERKWIDVKLPHTVPDDPIFVVNIGDCLSELCGGILPSTVHRVMPQDGTAVRNCLALFFGLAPDTIINLPSGETMSYEEWRKQRISRAADILKK